ncbi:DUF4328 domain-containing protein [Isoptericola sp. JC619]|uniref:DUF4328 domain-containing protein n=1 Tax=Isoptericola sediminis TaxID=2733572 RepID=A0A849KAI4_9MICO|nr:DUF4328 domain-containing protein [Isoptericola sediminis]
MNQPDPFVPPAGALPPAPATSGPAPARPQEPAYGAYAPAVAAAGPVRTGPWHPVPAVPAGLAGWTIGLAVAWTAFQGLAFWASFAAADAYGRAVDAGASVMDVFTWYDVVSLPFLMVQVATFVVACLWLQESRAVAVAVLPRERHVRRPLWIWFGWVVPVVSLWFPYEVVRDVRSGTTGLRGAPGLGLWWASWLIAMWASNQTGLAGVGLGVLSDHPSMFPFVEGVATVATAVACVQWIRIVREITAAQRARLEAPAAA